MGFGSKLLILRALCNGKTLAFQAKDAGSIPAARSNHSKRRYGQRQPLPFQSP
jgi:hypothetical protein